MVHKSKIKTPGSSIRENGASTETSSFEDSFTEEVIRAQIVARLAKELKLEIDDIDIQAPFTSHGLDSLKAFVLTGELADWLGHALPATLFWNYPTVEALSRHLAAKLITWRTASFVHHDVSTVLEEIEALSDHETLQELAEIKKKSKA